MSDGLLGRIAQYLGILGACHPEVDEDITIGSPKITWNDEFQRKTHHLHTVLSKHFSTCKDVPNCHNPSDV